MATVKFDNQWMSSLKVYEFTFQLNQWSKHNTSPTINLAEEVAVYTFKFK